MFRIVWRQADGSLIFIGLTEYQTRDGALDAVRTLWHLQYSDRRVSVETGEIK